jgi:hypothetical protein
LLPKFGKKLLIKNLKFHARYQFLKKKKIIAATTGNSYLVMEDDGSLLLLDGVGGLYWWSNTAGYPGVNFINILCTTFTLVDAKSVKNTVKS